jgi:predicted homoserine dehydrogenase-like protein
MSSKQSLDTLTFSEKQKILDELRKKRTNDLKEIIKLSARQVIIDATISGEVAIDAALKVDKKKILVEALKELIVELEKQDG